MDTSQIMCILNSDPILSKTAEGVFPADKLPKYINYGGFIANSDVSYKPGKHWCAFYFDGRGYAEFFDSYGKPPQYYNSHFVSCLQDNSIVQTYNAIKLQNNDSNVCAQFSLFFLIHRVRGMSLKDIVETLQRIDRTDQYVYDYVSRTFPYCIPTHNYIHCNQTYISSNKIF